MEILHSYSGRSPLSPKYLLYPGKTQFPSSFGAGFVESTWLHTLKVMAVAERLWRSKPKFWRAQNPQLEKLLLLSAGFHDVGKLSANFLNKYASHLVSGLPVADSHSSFCNPEYPHNIIGGLAVADYLQTRYGIGGKIDNDGSGRTALPLIVDAHHGLVSTFSVVNALGETLRMNTGNYVAMSGGDDIHADRFAFMDAIVDMVFSSDNDRDDFFYWYGNLEKWRYDDSAGHTASRVITPCVTAVAGCVVVADWLASDPNNFPVVSEGTASYTELRTLADICVVSKSGLILPELKDRLTPSDMFGAGFSLRKEQRIFKNNTTKHNATYILESSTGSGKTEAAMLAAYNFLSSGVASGVYVALPTQITSNQQFARWSEWLKNIKADPLDKQTAFLIHSDAGMVIDKLGVPVNDDEFWDTPKRAFLSCFGVGTVDQSMLGILCSRHFMIRMFSMAGKVVVFDEVHAYDIYMREVFKTLLSQLRELGCTIIILSATLTKAQKASLMLADMGDFKKDSSVSMTTGTHNPASNFGQSNAFNGTRVLEKEMTASSIRNICIKCWCDEEAMFKRAVDLAKSGYKVVWINNTVANAQKSYLRFKGVLGGFIGIEVECLHSCFLRHHRNEKESRWLKWLGKSSGRHSGGCVLVSTQIIEQSIDIDCDVMFTDLAPIDLMVQRMGRLQRFGSAVSRPLSCTSAEFHICTPMGISEDNFDRVKENSWDSIIEWDALIYRLEPLFASCVIINRFDGKTITIPDDVRPLVEEAYNFPYGGVSEKLKESIKNFNKEKDNKRAIAEYSLFNLWTMADRPNWLDKFHASSRFINEDKITVFLIDSYRCVGDDVIIHVSGSVAPIVLKNTEVLKARGVGYSAIRSAISSCKSEVIALNDYRVMIADNKVEKYRNPSAVTEILADYFGKVEFYCLNSFGDAVDDHGNRIFGYDVDIGASK